MKKLLIVNTLPEDDPAVSPALEVLGRGAEEVRVIHAFEKNLRPCIGCNACWLVTPGICAVKDGYEELLMPCPMKEERICDETNCNCLYIQHRAYPPILPIVRGTDWSSGLFS